MSLVRGDTLPLPAFTGMSLPEGMLDNPNISDFTFWVRGTAIYAQKCFLDSRLPNWKDLVGENESSIKFDVVSAATVRLLLLLVYTGSLRHLPQTTVGYAELHLIAEGFGLADLARACRRMVYATLGPTDALPLLMRFGRRSVRMRDVLAVHIVQNWAIVSASDAFRRLIDRPTRAGADALLAILQRMDTVPVDDDTAAPRRSRQPTPILDQRRFSAFRSLLDNPSVSDVHFIVEGRVITAQKSVLSEMSDYFAAMFGSGFSEGSTAGVTEIAIPDFSYGTVYSMLLYIYTCTLDAAPQTIEDIAHLYVIADKYDLPTLAEAAHQQLAGALEADAVAKFLFTFAARYPALRTLVLSVLMRDFERVKRSQGFEDALLGVEDSVEWSSLVSDILDCVSVRGFNTRADDDPSYKRGFDWDHDPESDEDYDDGDKHDNEEEEEEDEEVYALAQSHPTPASLEGSFCSTTAGTGALAAPSSPPPPLRLTPPMSPQGKRHAADDESVRRPEIDLVPQSPRRAEADENEEHSIDVADPVP
ncbi:hypothetical protein HKX48_004549 [Thoreauomyces humboldtii]|nr:hypothetical protein HKX48_004549 [Thoreauomyces humboldtii]